MKRTHTVAPGTMNFETQDTTPQAHVTQPKGNKNFLDFILNNVGMLTDEFILIGTKLVNQFTNKVAFNLDLHVNHLRRRGLDSDVAAPTLDQRNEQDEHSRGKDAHDVLTDLAGFEVALTPYEKAEIYEGLRKRKFVRD